MISRVRLEAFGPTASAVDAVLIEAARRIDEAVFLDAVRGEQVIERVFEEPDGSRHAFKGRLLLHPNVADDARQRQAFLASSSLPWYTHPQTAVNAA
jgi:hypothetical protein